MSRCFASRRAGSTSVTKSSPAKRRLFSPWTPSPTTTTRTTASALLVARVLLDRADLLEDLVGGDRIVAVVLALDAGCDVSQDRGDDIVFRRHHRERRVSKQRVAGAH